MQAHLACIDTLFAYNEGHGTMKKLSLILAATLLAGTTITGTASAREFDKIYKECGIGAMIFPETPIAATISNIIWDLGTTASSSDMSSPENCKGRTATAAAFIYNSHASLTEETVKGNGAHLNALLDIMECDKNSRSTLIGAMRSDLSEQIAAGDYTEQSAYDKAGNFYELFSKTSAKVCNNAS